MTSDEKQCWQAFQDIQLKGYPECDSHILDWLLQESMINEPVKDNIWTIDWEYAQGFYDYLKKLVNNNE